MDPSKNTGVPAPIQLFPSSPSIQSAQAPMQASYMPAATSPVYFNPSTAPFYPGQPQQVPQQSMVYFPSDQPTNYPVQAQQQAVYVATPPAGSHALPSAAMSDVALDKGDYDPAADDEMGMTQTEQAFGLHFNFDEKKQLDITSWFNRGWGLYKENWGYYTLFALAFYILTMLSWLGEAEDREESGVFLSLTYGIGWITWPMQLGYFVAGAHIVRHRVGPGPHATVPFSVSNLFRPFFVYFPLLLLTILYGLAVSLGLICLIIPGIYLAVTLSLAPYLYLENHHSVNFFDPQATSSFGVLNALSVSRRIIHTYFWKWFIFLIMVFLLNFFAGFLIVLPLVTVPVSNLALVFAYHDMVGLMPHRGLDTHCFCCC